MGGISRWKKTSLRNLRKAYTVNARNKSLAKDGQIKVEFGPFPVENVIEVKQERRNDHLGDETAEFLHRLPIMKSDPFNARLPDEGLGYRCLICYREDPNPQPLNGILPNPKGLPNPSQVEDDMRIIYLLKLMFQWSTVELDYLMERSEGQSPREWIHICDLCRVLVFELQSLEDKMRECREKIKEMVKWRMAPRGKAPMTMTRRIRGLVNRQRQAATSAARAAGTDFSKGDQEAERLVKLQIRRQKYLERKRKLKKESANPLDWDKDLGRSQLQEGDGSGEADLSKKNYSFINDVFMCPYGCSAEKKMNIASLSRHLIFHYDYPMMCSECEVFLPRDSPLLDGHWQQYHSDVQTTEEKRFLEKQVCVDLSEAKSSNAVSVSSPSPIKCVDCNDDGVTVLGFDDMNKFKIHQALEHPEIARVSCPFCLERFPLEHNEERNEIMLKHMITIHNVGAIKGCLKSYPCKFCGDLLSDDGDILVQRSNTRYKSVEKFHMITSHHHLINASFTCTHCSQEFSHLKDFMEHWSGVGGHPEMNLNMNAVHLCKGKRIFSCSLCKEKGTKFESLKVFLCHLTLSHSLYVRWQFDLLDPSIPSEITWKPVGEHVKEMTAFREKLDKMSKSNSLKSSARARAIASLSMKTKKLASHSELEKFQARDRQRSPDYECPSCPNLRKMNVDEFIMHLLFHWRHPNKCTLCNVYLPFAAEATEDHWKYHHPDVQSSSSTEVKSMMVAFIAGNIFTCQYCREKFPSSQDRNEHELSSHGICFPKIKSCNLCTESFPNTEEVRLHKALDHPEIASVSCYYCEELFPIESLEGGQYLDLEALQQHILQKDDHPKEETRLLCQYLHPCDFCGQVILDSFKFQSNRVRSHIGKVHGVLASKTPFRCFICNKRVTSLWKHLCASHAKNCICETCGEEMRPGALANHNLVKHDVLMEGYIKLSCKEEGCGYKTVHRNAMTHHISVNHSKEERERNHKCSFCGKGFYTADKMKEHEERHINEVTRPYQCEICGSSYKTRNTLYIHKRLSHLNKKFPSTNRKRPKQKPVETVAKQPDPGQEDAELSSLLLL